MNEYYESETTELKIKFTDALVREIVAFLNAHGGTIYIGINDNGEIVGVTNIDETLRKIGDIVSSQIEPTPSDLVKTSVSFPSGKAIIEF